MWYLEERFLRGDLVGGNQRGSNFPAFTAAVNARHSSGTNARFGPSGSFESRTATTPGKLHATSMHCPPLPLL